MKKAIFCLISHLDIDQKTQKKFFLCVYYGGFPYFAKYTYLQLYVRLEQTKENNLNSV